MNLPEIIGVFFKFQHSVKLFHWMTTSYPKHIASDKLLTNLLDLIDKFVEIYIGKYGRINVSFKLEIKTLNDTDIISELEKMRMYLTDKLPISNKDTDLLNIRDEMIGEINQTLYLMSLN